DLFERIRMILLEEQHPYANANQFGMGPNWRIRVVRVGLNKLGLDPNLVRHGIQREVYAMPLMDNWKSFLQGKSSPEKLERPTVEEISTAALARWIIPRSHR